MTQADLLGGNPVAASCDCGWTWTGPERAWGWIEDYHLHAHSKGRDGLNACARVTVACPIPITRWGVFISAPTGEPVERHRWSGNDLVPLWSREAAEVRAAEIRDLHPDWQVTAQETDLPLPGSWRETFVHLLPREEAVNA